MSIENVTPMEDVVLSELTIARSPVTSHNVMTKLLSFKCMLLFDCKHSKPPSASHQRDVVTRLFDVCVIQIKPIIDNHMDLNFISSCL